MTRRGFLAVAGPAAAVLSGAAGALGRVGTGAASIRTLRQDSGGAAPVGLRIPQALVDAPLEPRRIAAGTLEDPTGVWAAVWSRDTGRLGVPGNILVYGHSDWFGVGPAVFWFLPYLHEGDRVDVVGDDGNAYRFRVASVEILPPAAAVGALNLGDVSGEWLTLFTATWPFDCATQQYENYAVIRAERTDHPPRAVGARAFDADAALGCVPDALRSLAGEPSEAQPFTPEDCQGEVHSGVTFSGGEAVPREVVDDIEAQLAAATSCELSLRRALVLPDGRVAALVGPPGDLALDAVTDVTVPDVAPEAPGAYLCGFFAFTDEGDRWRAERFSGIH